MTHRVFSLRRCLAIAYKEALQLRRDRFTLGMIIGCFKGLVDDNKNDLISRNVGYMLLSGILVSLLSAGLAGLFIW